MTIPEIKTICYVGAGTMGCYNSLAAAVSGYQVVLYDRDERSLDQVEERHREMASMLVGGGYCTDADITAARTRIVVEPDLAQAVASADLVSESVSEDLEVKRAVHRQLETICPIETIITTNSSALTPSDIDAALVHGERFAALHSHLGSPLVDIVAGPRTNPALTDVLRRYVESTNGAPLLMKKEYPGYVLNAMLGPVLGAALALLIDGVATRDEIDRAWMLGLNASIGPFGMMDFFGLNVILDSWENREPDARTQRLLPPVRKLLRSYVEQAELGVKSGKGFYSYPAPAYQEREYLLTTEDPRQVQHALYAALISNAVLLVEAGIVEMSDVDRAWKVGTHINKGPFELLADMGHGAFHNAVLEEVSAVRIDSDKAAQTLRWLDHHDNDARKI